MNLRDFVLAAIVLAFPLVNCTDCEPAPEASSDVKLKLYAIDFATYNGLHFKFPYYSEHNRTIDRNLKLRVSSIKCKKLLSVIN